MRENLKRVVVGDENESNNMDVLEEETYAALYSICGAPSELYLATARSWVGGDG